MVKNNHRAQGVSSNRGMKISGGEDAVGIWQERKEKSEWLVKSKRKKPRINEKSGEGTVHRGWEVRRQEQR